MTNEVRVGDVYTGRGHRFPTFRVDSPFKSRYSDTPKVLVEYIGKNQGGRMEVLDVDFILNRCTLVRRSNTR